jgi:formate dehydrogenase major subunit
VPRLPPLLRQLTRDPLGLHEAAQSRRSAELKPRTATADRMVKSVCPYCAVGCGQRVYVKDEKVVQIEGDPDSPISRGRLCPKGAASENLVNSPTREDTDADGRTLKRTLGLAFLGGATLDTEENYLIKKCFTAAGALSIENQARI